MSRPNGKAAQNLFASVPSLRTESNMSKRLTAIWGARSNASSSHLEGRDFLDYMDSMESITTVDNWLKFHRS